MSSSELKIRIIERLKLIDDEATLKEIYDIIKIESLLDNVYKLTDEEKQAVNEGLKNIQYGKIFSSEKANGLIKSWLKK